MTVSISDRSGLLNLELRQLAERRLLFALSRFDLRIKQVELVVSDENGPRGGIDKACRVSVSLHRASDVVVSDRDAGHGQMHFASGRTRRSRRCTSDREDAEFRPIWTPVARLRIGLALAARPPRQLPH